MAPPAGIWCVVLMLGGGFCKHVLETDDDVVNMLSVFGHEDFEKRGNFDSQGTQVADPAWQPKECRDLNELVAQAYEYLPKMKQILAILVDKTGKGKAVCAPVKGGGRVSEKIADYDRKYFYSNGPNDYNFDAECDGGGKAHRCFTDFVRCSIVYDNAGDMNMAVPRLASELAKINQDGAADGARARFVRVKNRMNTIGDFLTNVAIVGGRAGACAFHHVGEIQLHLKHVIAAKQGPSINMGQAFGYRDLIDQEGVYKSSFNSGLIKAALELSLAEQDKFSAAGEAIPAGGKFHDGHQIYEAARTITIAESKMKEKLALSNMLSEKSKALYAAALTKAGYDAVKPKLGALGNLEFNVYKGD